MNVPMVFSAEVEAALRKNRPVVALESTIISHGMPYPQNIEMARNVEAELRANGVTPATIAVIDGNIRIGLDEVLLEELAQSADALKLSRADLAYAVASGRTGATTVAATMICANLAGIEVFATGGIGGVHRGASETLDISADLMELAASPVCVVAAGVKAILDIPKTLEVLETHGVPVITYGQDDFPAFWSASSGLKSPLSLGEMDDISAMFAMRRKLNIPGGMLLANPIPLDAEIPRSELEPIIESALSDTAGNGIIGKEVTPYLLSRIFELTNGRSLTANIELVLNNARTAANLAHSLAKTR